eukprot:PhF_6_TR14203/c1_g1_i1/m.22754
MAYQPVPTQQPQCSPYPYPGIQQPQPYPGQPQQPQQYVPSYGAVPTQGQTVIVTTTNVDVSNHYTIGFFSACCCGLLGFLVLLCHNSPYVLAGLTTGMGVSLTGSGSMFLIQTSLANSYADCHYSDGTPRVGCVYMTNSAIQAYRVIGIILLILGPILIVAGVRRFNNLKREAAGFVTAQAFIPQPAMGQVVGGSV